MIDLNKNYKKQIFTVMAAIFAVAFVLSTGSKVLAQTVVEVEAETPISVGEVMAAAEEPAVESGHGLDRVIKGTENWGPEHHIDPLLFIKNIGKSTGIYQMMNQKKVEPQAEFKPPVKEAPVIQFAKEKSSYPFVNLIFFSMICVIRISFFSRFCNSSSKNRYCL